MYVRTVPEHGETVEEVQPAERPLRAAEAPDAAPLAAPLSVPLAAHVMRLQRVAGNRAVRRLLARQTPTVAAPAKPTPAAYAGKSPQAEYTEILKRESTLLANASLIAGFLRARQSAAGAGAPNTPVTHAELLSEPALLKALTPKPKSPDDLQPTLDLLVYYGVLAPAALGYTPVLDPVRGDLKTDKLDKAAKEIPAFAKAFEKRAGEKDSVDPVGMTELIDDKIAAGAASEKKADRQAMAAVADLEAKLNALTGTEPDVEKRRAALQAQLEKAQKRLARAQGYRTFAVEVADFLNRLRSRASNFVGGTYPHHDWGENSVDVFLNTSVDDQGFYKVSAAEAFLDAVNDTANEDGPYGKCAWRAVYNDDRLIARIEAKYGARRVTKAPHHGPAPDKLHIHLDVRPVKLLPDRTTGFYVNQSGRVELYQ